jgi:hypothetical protein
MINSLLREKKKRKRDKKVNGRNEEEGQTVRNRD